jgi:2-iminobutanoate/2-iminopropanoate deaminase
MTVQRLTTPDAPRPAGAYAQGVLVDGLVFTAGFGPQDPITGAVPDGVAAQTRQVLRNVEATLREAGATLADVVKTTAHLQHLKRDFAAYDAAYREAFGGPEFPARTTVGSDLYDILVEIDVVARVPRADA